jgi:hypothetical protein
MRGNSVGLAIVGALCAAVVRADDTAKDFRTAKTAILHEIKDRRPEVRVAAVTRLGDYPGLEPAKILLLQGISSQYEDVQKAALQSLLKFSQTREVCDYLKADLAKDVKKGQIDASGTAALAVLLASDIPEIQKDVRSSLDKIMASPDGALRLVTLVDALGAAGDDGGLKALLKVREVPLFQKFGPRRALAQALVQFRNPDAVTALIDILRTVQGETRVEISRYLTAISGQSFDTPDGWLEWWKKERDGFMFPPAAAQAAFARAAQAGPSYYGLPIYGTKIVFVIDVSASMRGPRIDAAKRELMKAINELKSGTDFNVLAFSIGVTPWQSQLVPATNDNKQSAVTFVYTLPLGSRTASYDALESALSFDAESIYFLTDGAPTDGKIKQPDQIVEVISKANRVRRVTINSIGIGVGPEGGPFDVFLKTLAARDFGSYRRVDE